MAATASAAADAAGVKILAAAAVDRQILDAAAATANAALAAANAPAATVFMGGPRLRMSSIMLRALTSKRVLSKQQVFISTAENTTV